jgi:hypothetical protein
MAVGTPTAFYLTCPRCKIRRAMVNVDGGTLFRCAGCEWHFTMATQSPTGTTNASRSVGAATLPVASGGASFTTGMLVLVETGPNAEVVTVTSTGSATSIPITPLGKAHNSGVAIGQLLITATYSGIGVGDAIPAAPGWGF